MQQSKSKPSGATIAAAYLLLVGWDMKKPFNLMGGNTQDGKQSNHHLAVGKHGFFKE